MLDVPIVGQATVRNAPVAVAALEGVEVTAGEVLEVLALLVAATVPCDDLGLHFGRRCRGELDQGVRREVLRGDRILAQLCRRSLGEIGGRTLHRPVVRRGVGMERLHHQVGITGVDALAVLQNRTPHGALCIGGVDRREWTVDFC